MLKIVLITCSSLFLVSCLTLSRYEKWPLPEKPVVKHVKFIPIEEAQSETNGFYISNEAAAHLVDNISELKTYILKLETLIGKMENYYKEK